MSAISTSVHETEGSRVIGQEVIVLNFVLVPAAEEGRLVPVYDTLLLGKYINCVRPKHGDELDDGVSAAYNTGMRPVVDGQLKRLRGLSAWISAARSKLLVI